MPASGGEIMTVDSIFHENEITLWWDEEWELDFLPLYSITLDGCTEDVCVYIPCGVFMTGALA